MDESRLVKILQEHKEVLRKAEFRKGQQPNDLMPRAQLIGKHMMDIFQRRMQQVKLDSRGMTTTNMIGERYLPSIAPLETLHKISIRDLKLETHHRGSFLLLRSITPAIRYQSVASIVEDENSVAVRLSLYQQEPETIRKADDILKQSAVIILKEPYFKIVGSGGYGIRVDHPSDIVWLEDNDSRVPSAWKPQIFTLFDTADEWKQEGNDLFNAGKYREAVKMYVTSC